MAFILAALGIVSTIGAIVCYCWCMVMAFRTSIVWGLVYFFVPLGSLAFVVMHWQQTKLQFLGFAGSMFFFSFVSMVLPLFRGH